MAERRSWLRTRQSLCLFLPCRRLPDRIREELYRREMKMSEFWLSCSVSCGTSMFGLLWKWSRRFLVPAFSYCTVSGGCQDGILRKQMGSRHGSRAARLLVVQEIRIGVSCFSRIGKTKINGICSSGHMDGRENSHCLLAQWAVQCFRERAVGGLNNYGPCAITNSHRAAKVNAPEVVKRDSRDNHCACHAAVTTRPGLSNGDCGSDLRNFDADGPIAAGYLCVGHPSVACG